MVSWILRASAASLSGQICLLAPAFCVFYCSAEICCADPKLTLPLPSAVLFVSTPDFYSACLHSVRSLMMSVFVSESMTQICFIGHNMNSKS